jgi:RNA polymerase sigma-70 factor (ECF subfamily)
MLLRRDNPRSVPDVSPIEPDAEGWTLATRLTDVRDFPRAGLDLDDDKSLVLAFQSGDIDAYSDIFVKYRALSAQICYRILQDREEADEAVQETMLRVYRGLGTFNGRYQLQAWVARIATNVSLDMVRARARRPQRDPVTPDISENARLIVALTDDPSEAVERVLDQEEIRSILSEIPDHHREALVLREFEGRSHEEIGEALGVSPQQAKALIHRAKKSFRRAWDRGGERRGVAGLAPIILLAPFRLPGFLRKLLQPAHDVVASATATAQQAAVQVTAAPAVTQGAVSMADKVTAAAITVIVAGTVSVGAVIQHTQKPSKPTPVTASPAPVPVAPPAVIVAPLVRSKPVVKPHHKAHHKPADTTQGNQGQTGTVVPVETPTDSPSPTDPSATPPPVTPPPPPPAPAWSGVFTTSEGIQATNLEQVSQHVTGQHSDPMLFGEVVHGALVDAHGKPIGTVYLDFGGSIVGTMGSLSSLWLWIDTPDGHYSYAAAGSLQAATQAADGSTTYVFAGGFSLASVPSALDAAVPHDGILSISLGFWGDGTLYATTVSMDES